MQITYQPITGPRPSQAYRQDLDSALRTGLILPQDYLDTSAQCTRCDTPAQCRASALPGCGPAALVAQLRGF